MVHYPNATIDIAELTVTKNSEGVKVKEYDFESPLDSFRADVQPNTLTQEQITVYGINTRTAKTKKIFYTKSDYMVAGNRARVTFDDGKIELYNICPVNEWRVHCEALLIPVENEADE